MNNLRHAFAIVLVLFLSAWGVDRATHHHLVHWSVAEEPMQQQQQQQPEHDLSLAHHGGQVIQDKDNIYEVVGDLKSRRIYIYVPTRPETAIPTVLAGTLPRTMVVKALRNGTVIGTSRLAFIQDPPPDSPSYWGSLPSTVNSTEGLKYELER